MSTAATTSPGAAGAASLSGWQAASLFGAAYFACAEAGRFLSVPDKTYVSFWLPAALYVSALVLRERRDWAPLVAAALAANLAFDLLYATPALAALGFSLTNTVQAVISASLVRRFLPGRPVVGTLRAFLGFLLFTAVLGSLLGAACGAETLVRFGLSDSFVQSFKVWWGSNAMSILLFAPFILTWFSGEVPDRHRLARPARVLEAGLLLLALAAATWRLLAAGGGVMAPDKGWLMLPLLWAGLRFGPRGAAAANLLLAAPIAFFTTQYHAGLAPEQIAGGEYVFVMQTALAVAALVALVPAIVLNELDMKMLELRENEARLRLAVQASDVGLWDWDIARDRLYYSPEWKRQLGYGVDEIPNRYEEWRERLHPEDRPRVLPKIRAYLNDPGPSYEAEFRLRHRNGSYRWIYARAQVETDAEGRPHRMLGCHIDVTERKLAEARLLQSFSRLQELSRRLAEVEESERRRINRELHDRVGQNLSALNLSLNLVRSQLPAAAPAGVAERLEDAQHLAETAVRQVRDVMAELRPPALDDYGLLAALRAYAEPLAARSGVPVVVDGQEPAPRLAPATETALFRIAQEALTNAAKHARAARIEVRLVEWNGRVVLTLSDDGIGFDPDSAKRGRATWGLRTMRERAEAVGAMLRVDSARGRGAQVVVEVERETP